MIECLWAKPMQREVIQDIVAEAIRKHGYSLAVNLQMLRREVEDFEEDVNEEIQVKHTIAEEQLLPIKEEYFELIKKDSQFEGVLVQMKQFHKLSLNEESVTNFYDPEGNLVNRLKAQKGTQEHTIDIFYNSEKLVYSLKTKKAERSEIIFKKPHSIVVKFWEERYEKILNYIQTQEKRMKEDTPEEVPFLKENLFVKEEWSEIVLANLEEVRQTLERLLLRLEKIRHSYQSF